ncbi:hypothetical protein T190_25250 [Sinorhizobium meliloti CCBAU 01290]|nr:hypothetical protein T190_25250 [Sinorhizobium meliloti CCBAU 01290]
MRPSDAGRPKLARLAVQIVREPKDFRGCLDLLLDLRLRPAGDGKAERHVVEYGEVRIERIGLEDHGDDRFDGSLWVTSSASILISPPVVSSSPAIMRNSVDFPQPEGPTKTANSPCPISISTPWITFTAPNDLLTPVNLIPDIEPPR